MSEIKHAVWSIFDIIPLTCEQKEAIHKEAVEYAKRKHIVDNGMWVTPKEAIEQARREGWEQGKKQAKDAVECADYDLDDYSRRTPEYVAIAAIAAMEYEGEK